MPLTMSYMDESVVDIRSIIRFMVASATDRGKAELVTDFDTVTDRDADQVTYAQSQSQT